MKVYKSMYDFLKTRRYLRNVVIYFKQKLISNRLHKFGSELLIEISELSTRVNGLIITPSYGTLLGFYRDGKLIKHDMDIDLFVFDKTNGLLTLEFYRLLLSNGYSILNFDDTVTRNLFKVRKNKVNIDLYLFNYDGSLYIRRNSYKTNHFDEIADFVYLKEWKILPVPSNTIDLLVSWYGNEFDIPDKYPYQFINSKK